MKVFQTGFLLLVIVVVATFADKDDDAWEEYKKKNNKNHKDAKEEAKRKELFLQTHRRIVEHNKRNHTWEAAHNEYSDWTPEEKKQLAGRKNAGQQRQVSYELLDERLTRQLPTSLDYRNDSCVGPVKNQGSCGSCWAFSSIVPLEFLYCKYRKAYIPLSEQQLVNCACNGCSGGDYYPAWSYLNKTLSGSVTSSIFPYKAVKGTCQSFTSAVIKPVSWGTVPADVTSIMTALKTYGPLSMAMNVANSFYSYAKGVYDATDCFDTYWDLDHAMAMVGYGKDAATGLDYWVIRNSWGSGWGTNGYMLVRKGVNRCGVETDVAFAQPNLPVVF